jgi:hypothetical protein
MFKRRRDSGKTYLICDESARAGGPSSAHVLDRADTIEDARMAVRTMWPKAVIVECDDDGERLSSGKIVG